MKEVCVGRGWGGVLTYLVERLHLPYAFHKGLVHLTCLKSETFLSFLENLGSEDLEKTQLAPESCDWRIK